MISKKKAFLCLFFLSGENLLFLSSSLYMPHCGLLQRGKIVPRSCNSGRGNYYCYFTTRTTLLRMASVDDSLVLFSSSSSSSSSSLRFWRFCTIELEQQQQQQQRREKPSVRARLPWWSRRAATTTTKTTTKTTGRPRLPRPLAKKTFFAEITLPTRRSTSTSVLASKKRSWKAINSTRKCMI